MKLDPEGSFGRVGGDDDDHLRVSYARLKVVDSLAPQNAKLQEKLNEGNEVLVLFLVTLNGYVRDCNDFLHANIANEQSADCEEQLVGNNRNFYRKILRLVTRPSKVQRQSKEDKTLLLRKLVKPVSSHIELLSEVKRVFPKSELAVVLERFVSIVENLNQILAECRSIYKDLNAISENTDDSHSVTTKRPGRTAWQDILDGKTEVRDIAHFLFAAYLSPSKVNDYPSFRTNLDERLKNINISELHKMWTEHGFDVQLDD